MPFIVRIVSNLQYGLENVWEHPAMTNHGTLELVEASHLRKVLMIFKIYSLICGIYLRQGDLLEGLWN
jgi:hypothetical protein